MQTLTAEAGTRIVGKLVGSGKVGEAVANLGVKTTSIANRIIEIKNNIWELSAFIRGKLIDTDIVGNNPGTTFPKIDNLFTIEGGLVESTKSMDIINSSTYQTKAGITSKVKGYVDDIAGRVEFGGKNGNKLLSKGNEFSRTGLNLVIPEGSINVMQSTALSEIRAYATSKNVEFVLTVLRVVK